MSMTLGKGVKEPGGLRYPPPHSSLDIFILLLSPSSDVHSGQEGWRFAS